MEKRWVLKQYGDRSLVEKLAKELQVGKTSSCPEDLEAYKIIANLLVQRGINNYDDAKSFFRPKLEDLHNPFIMNDMDIAVERVMSAIEKEEKILVYGDYDVDGTSAVALVYSYLREIYHGVDFYIPDRYGEGYGVSYKAINWAIEEDFKLIISLDCGIKAIEQVAYSSSKGIDFIIADHHLPDEELPKACAVLNPKRIDTTYPYRELSGCGVGFKLIHALNIKLGKPFEDIIPYLDLVAIAIAADVVPITGENRILAYYGLKVINQKPRPGLEAILKYADILHLKDKLKNKLYFKRELNINDLVFLICPRINAAGRIETGNKSVELLISKDIIGADKIARKINNNNDRRKELDILATEEALEMILNSDDLNTSKATVAYKEDWNKGIVGIVASRLIEKFYKPTIVFTKSNDLITGSARSVKGFDIYSAIESCSHLLEHFGGHKYAAGLSLKEENLKEFVKLFKEKVGQKIEKHQSSPEIEIDDTISLREITPKLYRLLKQFSPFGPDNSIPIFQSNNVVDTGYVRPVGQNHLKFSAIHLDIGHMPFSCIGFGLSNYYEDMRKGKAFDIVYYIEENEWNGKISLQLNIKDIKLTIK